MGDPACLPRVVLADRNQRPMPRRCEHRQIEIDQLRNRQPHQRLEHPRQRPPQHTRLVRNLAGHQRRHNRVRPMGEGRHVHHRGAGANPATTARRGQQAHLDHRLPRIDVPLDHHLGVGGHFQVDGATLDQLAGLAPQKPRQGRGVAARRQRGHRRQQTRRIAAQHHRRRHPGVPLPVAQRQRGRVVVGAPAYTEPMLAQHADIVPPHRRPFRLGVGREKLRPGNPRVRLLLAALERRQLAQIDVLAQSDHLLARARTHRPRRRRPQRGPRRRALDPIQPAFRPRRVDQFGNLGGHFRTRPAAQRTVNPFVGPQQIREHRQRTTSDSPEQQRRPPRSGDSVRHLRHLQHRIDLGLHPDQFPGLPQLLQEFRQTWIRHGDILGSHRTDRQSGHATRTIPKPAGRVRGDCPRERIEKAMTHSLNVHWLPTLVAPEALAGSTVVVIDVLRASTTICQALEAGAREVIPCLEVEDALAAAARLPDDRVVLGGERNGLPIAGFDLGNSPIEYTPQAVGGRTIVLTTTNGTRAMAQCRQASRILIGAFVNATAVYQELVGQPRIDLISAGSRGQRSRDDELFAGLLTTWLDRHSGTDYRLNNPAQEARQTWLSTPAATYTPGSSPTDPKVIAPLLTKSIAGQRLSEINRQADILFAAQLDRFRTVPELDVSTFRIRHV